MKPYALELKYSHLEDLRSVIASSAAAYEVDDAAGSFERRVQTDLATAREHHLRDELGAAMRGYEELQASILKTAHPSLPVGVVRHPRWEVQLDPALFPRFVAMAAELVGSVKPPLPAFPPEVRWPIPVGPEATLPAFLTAGPSAPLDGVRDVLQDVSRAATAGRWDDAAAGLRQALTTADDTELIGHLQHDLGLALERAGDPIGGRGALDAAQTAFQKAGSADGQVTALGTLSGLLARQGDADGAAAVLGQATDLARRTGVHQVEIPVLDLPHLGEGIPFRRLLRAESAVGPALGQFANRAFAGGPVADAELVPAGRANGPIASVAADAPALTALGFVAQKRAATSLNIVQGDGTAFAIALDADRATNLTRLYETMIVTSDLALLHFQAVPAPTLVAYLPHIYFFVLPMSIGDCQAAMGAYEQAERSYLAALRYPFLNETVEVVKLWTRLAELYLAWGDTLYRAAGDDLAATGPAAQRYQQLVGADGGVPAGSPLYADGRFAGLAARVGALLAAADPAQVEENAAVALPIARARLRLGQLRAGFNFLGFAPDHVPPFSFEHLQTTARYLAQHAATLEQSYIQFKSQAENEEFRLDQMDQQVDLAAASVRLEESGVREAQAGRRVAEQSADYAAVQRANAEQARDGFDDVRWELAELTEIEAWAQASSVDRDDQVLLTTSGYEFYGSDRKRRNVVLKELAAQRTAINHDMEAARLAREVASAEAYEQVAAAQVAQAALRVETAGQRVAVARLQQRQAQENREFLDLKEFSARHWYDMAKVMRGLSQDYLDMATGIAWLTERAYAAETGRDPGKIRLDYRNAGTGGAGGVLGADVLLRDVDFLTVDHLTSTRSKKAPLKVAISLADAYPSALRSLRETGAAFFETTLEQLDRRYPGFYLHKVRNVELQLIGVTVGRGVAGTLRNVGVSTFRDVTGAVRSLVYPSDVLPLSLYDIRADALVFRASPAELRLFENNGAATMWRVELPASANDIDPAQLLDVQLVLSLDAFFDATLEASVRASLPTTGTGARHSSLRLDAPDELFFLRSQGRADLAIGAGELPRSQRDHLRTAATLRVTGDGAAGRAVRLTPRSTGVALDAVTDADGLVPAADLAALVGGPVADAIVIETAPEAGLTDVQLYQEYSFDWR